MYLKRLIDSELSNWKNDKFCKPLLVRGARQVGKTETIRNLGNQFEYFIEINFESNKTIHTLFTGNLSAAEISENISAIYKTPVISGKTLIFFDEIQTCIPAIQSLRFFYEQTPDLHIISAGSLLEFTISEIPSFGVGRIRSLFMYPFSFDEFLSALNETGIIEMKKKSGIKNTLNEAIHNKLLKYLRKFLIIGGMPEVVSNYIHTNDLNKCFLILNDLKNSYFDDFAKYKKIVPVNRIADVFNSVVMQSGGKFVYSKIQNGDNHKQIKEALELLILAGIVIPVVHTSANGLPLGAEVDNKKRKMLVLDTGLFLNILNLNISEIILAEDFTIINKGSLTEMFVGLELMKYNSPYQKNNLYYWHREAKNSNAEIDYLLSNNNKIIPIEIKSGTKGSMKSMNIFLESKNIEKGIRISSESFSAFGKTEVLPLYAISNLF
jgi:predicted AAA+ superfamily ATPase